MKNNDPLDGPVPLLSPELIAGVFFRHKLLCFTCTVVGIGIAAGLYVVTPTEYRSEAKLLVRYVKDSTAGDPTADERSMSKPDRSGLNMINSELEILTSFDLLEKVARAIGPSRILSASKGQRVSSIRAANSIMKHLEIEVPRSTSVIKLGYFGSSPEVTRDVLQRLISGYLEKHLEVHRAGAAFDYLAKQTDQLRASLNATDEDLRSLKQEQGVVDIERRKAVLNARLDQLQAVFDATKAERAAIQARVDLYTERFGQFTPVEAPPTASAEMINLQRRIVFLQGKELELLKVYSVESVPVQQVRQQIAELEKMAGWEEGGMAAWTAALVPGVNEDEVSSERALFQERAALASQEAKITVLQEQIDDLNATIVELHRNEGRIVQLQRTRELQEANFRYFSENLEKARIDAALRPDQMTNINIVQPATLPNRGLRPGLKRKMAMSAAGGLGTGLGIAFLLELIAVRLIRRPSEIEDVLQIPTLISLPKETRFQDCLMPSAQTDRLALPDGSNVDDESRKKNPSLLQSSVRGYFEALFHRIELTGIFDDKVPHLIGVIGCGEDAGSTTVAAGLAATVAEQGLGKVLYIDAVMGSNGTNEMFNMNAESSLIDILDDGQGSSIRVTKDLHVLPAGNANGKSLPSSIGRRFRELVEFLRTSNYNTVVVDLPPIFETSPSLQIAGLLDGVLMVIESDKVQREDARQALRMLRQTNAQVIGAVLNKRRKAVRF